MPLEYVEYKAHNTVHRINTASTPDQNIIMSHLKTQHVLGEHSILISKGH